MKVYIAGKITGEELFAAARFAAAEEELRSLSHVKHVVNPMKLPHKHDKAWHSYLAECIKSLVDCDAVYLLEGWFDSRGARLELDIAVRLGKEIFYQSNKESLHRRLL